MARPPALPSLPRATGVAARHGIDFRMAEFFVARPFRRLGVGRTAVPLVLDRFAGRWQIMEYGAQHRRRQFLAGAS